ncbi:MAG: dipeptidase [Sphingomonadales bacterium]|jgi:membrane dipeptidase
MKKILFGFTAALALSAPALAQVNDPEFETFHQSLLTLDTHTDVDINLATDLLDPSKLTPSQVDLVKMKKGGLDAVFFIAYSKQRERTDEGLAQARKDALIKTFAIKRMVEKNPDLIEFARTADDVRRINSEGKLVALLGVENGFPVGDDPDWVKIFHDAGARYMGFTHFGHNQLGDSSNPDPELGDEAELHGGLSDVGRTMLSEMNYWGIVPDVSHSAMTTTIQAARLSKAPIMASHSGVRAVANVERNLSDEALLAIKENGGVAQMVALGAYVKKDPERVKAIAALREKFGITDSDEVEKLDDAKRMEYDARMAKLDELFPPANVSNFVDHIDYAVKKIGIDHVGIASDFDGGGGIVGWQDASETPNVTAELLSRGYSAEDIQKLWSGNTLRIMAEAEAVAAELQTVAAMEGQTE